MQDEVDGVCVGGQCEFTDIPGVDDESPLRFCLGLLAASIGLDLRPGQTFLAGLAGTSRKLQQASSAPPPTQSPPSSPCHSAAVYKAFAWARWHLQLQFPCQLQATTILRVRVYRDHHARIWACCVHDQALNHSTSWRCLVAGLVCDLLVDAAGQVTQSLVTTCQDDQCVLDLHYL